MVVIALSRAQGSDSMLAAEVLCQMSRQSCNHKHYCRYKDKIKPCIF